jgi:AhpD family alkylhydroperoxidase
VPSHEPPSPDAPAAARDVPALDARVAAFDARVPVYDAWPPLYEGILQLTKLAHGSGLDARLLQLVDVRASQLNGCAYCLDLHAGMAVKVGEEQRRLHTVAAWRDAGWFSPAEKAALALTEEVTLLHGPPSETTVDDVRRHFGDDGLAKLLLAIVAINAWNRVNVAAQVRVGGAGR